MATREASHLLCQPSPGSVASYASMESDLPSLLSKLATKDSICRRSSMKAIKELIERELNEDSMAFFTEVLLGTMDKRSKHYVPSVEVSPSSLAHSICYLLVELVSRAAQTQVKVGASHISSITKAVVSWFPLENGSQSTRSLHQACAKLVCSVAENAEIYARNLDSMSSPCLAMEASSSECYGSTCTSTSECHGSTCSAHFSTSSHDSHPPTSSHEETSGQLHHQSLSVLMDCLCRPLLGALCSRVEPVSVGASTCLDALVSMEATWSLASPHLVEELCFKASSAIQERTALSANIPLLSLLCNMAKTNPESLSCFKSGLLKKGADILLNINGAWQRRAAAVRLMESLLIMQGTSASVENKQDMKAVMHAIETLESCRLDKVAMVRSAVGEALKAAKQHAGSAGDKYPPMSPRTVDKSSTGHTKASRLGPTCLQASEMDYRRRRRKKPLGLHEKQLASSLSPCRRSEHFPRRTPRSSSSSTWSSSDSVGSSIDFECPRRKWARVGCNWRTSASASGVIGAKTSRPSDAKKVVTSPPSSPSAILLASSSSSPSSSVALSPSLSSLTSSSSSSPMPPPPPPSSPPSWSPSSLSSSAIATHHDAFSSHSCMPRPSSSSTCSGHPTADIGCLGEEIPRAGCIGRSAGSSFCECACFIASNYKTTQDLMSPTSSSASCSSKPVSKDEARVSNDRCVACCCTTSNCQRSCFSTYDTSNEETEDNEDTWPLLQKECSLALEPIGFTRVDKNDTTESSWSKEEEPCLTSLNIASKEDVIDEDFVGSQCCSSTSTPSIHYNSIAQLESLEEVISPQVCETGMNEEDSFVCSTPRTLFPSYNASTGLFEQPLPWASTDAIDVVLPGMRTEICSDSVWRVRDNPIAADDSEPDSPPRPTIFDSYTIVYCDDGDDCVPRHRDDDDDLDILTGNQNNGLRCSTGESGSLPREHQRSDIDEGLENRNIHNDDAFCGINSVLGECHRGNDARDDGNDMLVARKTHQKELIMDQKHLTTDNIVCGEHLTDISCTARGDHSSIKATAAKDNTFRDYSSEQNDEALSKDYIASPLVMKMPRCKELQNVSHACAVGVCETCIDDVDPLGTEHDGVCHTILALGEGANYPLPNELRQVNNGACLLSIQEDDVNQPCISIEHQQRISMVRDREESEDFSDREEETLKPAMAMEDLQVCPLVKTSCDEEDHGGGGQGEDGGNSITTWFSRLYVAKKWNVVFSPCGVFILTLALPLAIVAYKALSSKEDTTHLLVPT